MQRDDVQLEAPVARHPDVVPAKEDRTYVGFVGSALAVAIAGGFVLATLLPLIETGTLPGVERVPRLIQAHGWAQLQGWAGLFIAGMAIRLIPRFAGRRPISARITLPILLMLLGSVIVRTVSQPFIDGAAGKALLVLAGIAAAAGIASVAGVVLVSLFRGRKRGDAWEIFAWAGGSWWLVWSIYTLVAAFRASEHNLITPAPLDDALTWIVMLGAIGNFIWAVQCRSVPVFFGRKAPRRSRMLAPFAALNGGVLLIAVSQAAWPDEVTQRLFAAGLLLVGLAMLVLAPQAGSIWGKATRLRPRSRAAARYVLAANWWAIVAAILLIYAGARSGWTGEFESFAARDAARHAFGVGLITMLIPGMAQLVAPMFALSRAEAKPPDLMERAPFWLLIAAATLRVGAGLAFGHGGDARLHTVALAGALAWLALVIFAISVFLAVRAEPRMKQILAESAAAAAAAKSKKA